MATKILNHPILRAVRTLYFYIDEPKTYYFSESRQMSICIQEMNSNHLMNAFLKQYKTIFALCLGNSVEPKEYIRLLILMDVDEQLQNLLTEILVRYIKNQL